MSYLVKDYMEKSFPKISEEASATDAAKAMSESGGGFLIVLEGGQPRGIITEGDLVGKVMARELDPGEISAGEIMSSPLITVDPDDDLLKASEAMQKNNVRRLPVVRDGIIYGVVTAQDIAQRCGDYVSKSIRDILRWSQPI
ncbi:MAG: CBS domain-containing protein [Candidatus Bathyarchaeota archaeon]|nr:CBS domain-containing protein [Candidatus Bathyarchaeota archaeon]MDH5791729.1 CBS domain-containing protein [Candidatus Bathyarchaeota archaeon]